MRRRKHMLYTIQQNESYNVDGIKSVFFFLFFSLSFFQLVKISKISCKYLIYL